MNRAQRRRAKDTHFAVNNHTPSVFLRPQRTLLAQSVRLACANWHQADRVTPDWWASALEAR